MTRLAGQIRAASSDEGAVLLDIQRGRMFTLNPTGSRILELIEAGTPFDQIASRIAAEFSVSPETVLADAAQFLVELRQHALIDSSR